MSWFHGHSVAVSSVAAAAVADGECAQLGAPGHSRRNPVVGLRRQAQRQAPRSTITTLINFKHSPLHKPKEASLSMFFILIYYDFDC